jgi:hypothetical protein
MTNKDETAPRSLAVDLLILAGLAIALIFCIGVTVGFFSTAGDHAPAMADLLVGGGVLLIAAICGWQLIVRAARLLPLKTGKVAPSVRKSRNIWAFCLGLGFILGAAIALISIKGGETDSRNLFANLLSDAPVSPTIATVMLIGLALASVATVLLYRTTDEHERAAQEFASLIAINFYVVLVFGWAIAAKGGLVGAVDHMAVFGAVLLSWFAAWLWRRYR